MSDATRRTPRAARASARHRAEPLRPLVLPSFHFGLLARQLAIFEETGHRGRLRFESKTSGSLLCK